MPFSSGLCAKQICESVPVQFISAINALCICKDSWTIQLIFKKFYPEIFYFPNANHLHEWLMSEWLSHILFVTSRITLVSVARIPYVAIPGLLHLPVTSQLSYYGYWVSVVVADVIMVSSGSCVTSHLVATWRTRKTKKKKKKNQDGFWVKFVSCFSRLRMNIVAVRNARGIRLIIFTL